MGRVENRKINKKQKKINKVKNNKNENPYNEVYKLLKIIIIILIVLVLIYLLIGIFVTKEIKFGKEKISPQETTINSNNILASETFKQKEEKYYVYFYDFNDANSEIDNKINSADIRTYRVDTSSAFNKKCISDNSNPNVNKDEDLKIDGSTLIAIENGKNVAYIETEEQILSYLMK